jgi:putative ABC transport system permease protein
MFSIINISGLALGIICFFLIYLFVNDELNYDRFHTKAERIYRVSEFIKGEGGAFAERSSSLPFPAGPALQDEFPNLIAQSVRFFNFQAPMLSIAYEPTEKAFNEQRFFFADSNYYQVFDFDLAYGEAEKVLANPNSVVITRSIAAKYFGDEWTAENVIGKELRLQGQENLKITGILEDPRLDAHFQYDFLASFSTLRSMMPSEQLEKNWYWNPCWTYILFQENIAPEQLTTNFQGFIDKYFYGSFGASIVLGLQPLIDIHLHSNLDFEIQPNSTINSIYIFSGIALFVLLIACINFINLATAKSVHRAKEVAVRKTLGGKKYQLIFQFLSESVLMSSLAVLSASVCISFIIPWFNDFTNKSVDINVLNQPYTLVSIAGFTLFVGILSGFYPAIILSKFNPISALKSVKMQGQGVLFRKVLVTIQFAVSIMLIAGTLMALKQLRFMQNTDTGFQQENIIMVPVIRTPMGQHYDTYKKELLEYSNIKSVTALEEILGAKHQGANYTFEGMNDSQLFSRLCVRYDFTKTFNINMLAGRDYSDDFAEDEFMGLVVNAALAKSQGWSPEEAIGKTFVFGNANGNIVGVVDDFHFTSKHKVISPLVLDLYQSPRAFELFIKYLAIRVSGDDLKGTLEYVEAEWKKLVPDRAFEYFFLDQNLQQLYETEEKLSNVAGIFALIAIIVASLGLLGLSAYMAEQRKKEISIRKVMGSSISQVVVLLSKDFIQIIGLAFILACPLAYFGLEYWLDQFAYRVDIDYLYFAYAGIIVMFFAIGTITIQTLRVATVNPAFMLKDD